MSTNHPSFSLYQPELKGRSLFDAAVSVGHLQGECIYAQAMYLRDIEAQKLYFDFGFSSLEAMARALWDWSGRKTHEILEVACGIEAFPKINQAFRKGRLAWTKARLLVRILSALDNPEERKAADESWVRKIGLSYRQLERSLICTLPEEAQAAGIDEHLTLQLQLTPETYALWEKAYDWVKKELCEGRIQGDPVEVIEAMARLVLASKKPQTKVVEAAELSFEECPKCKQVSVKTRAYGPIALKQRNCSREGSRHIPTATYQRLLEKHEHHCAVPGCQHHLWLHAHHIHEWAKGGDHNEGNLILLCSRHHRMLHEGKSLKLEVGNGQAVFRDRFGDVIGARRHQHRDLPDISAYLLRVREAVADYCDRHSTSQQRSVGGGLTQIMRPFN